MYATLLVIGAIILFFFFAGIRIVNEYERGVVLNFGKYTKTKMPGFRWLFIVSQKMMTVDLRVTTVDVPRQEAITKDNVPVGVNAVVYFRVQKPELAVLKVKDFRYAVSQYAVAALRDIIGGVDLDTLLVERDRVATEIKQMVDLETDPWGIDVTAIKMQDIELPASMKRSMAAQAEAERTKRAIIIKSLGEAEAAKNLSQAAQLLTSTKGGLSLRTLETIDNLQADPSKTVIFALPTEIMEGFKKIVGN
jgi:regulator of protease activity HflC (stomatin/prohibitin superfamily)